MKDKQKGKKEKNVQEYLITNLGEEYNKISSSRHRLMIHATLHIDNYRH